jgi:hypothetical protein
MSQGRSVPAQGKNGQKGQQLQALICLEITGYSVLIEFGIMRVADFVQNGRFSAAC